MARRKMAQRRDEMGYAGRRSGGNKKWWMLLAVTLLVAGFYVYTNPKVAPAWLRGYLHSPAAKTVYKWRDDQGFWQYTATAPVGRPYEKMNYWENANILPAQEDE